MVALWGGRAPVPVQLYHYSPQAATDTSADSEEGRDFMEHVSYELPQALSTLSTHDMLSATNPDYDNEPVGDFADSIGIPLDVYFDLHD
jgi:hypothetical protein